MASLFLGGFELLLIVDDGERNCIGHSMCAWMLQMFEPLYGS
jgi:hypothetical protein